MKVDINFIALIFIASIFSAVSLYIIGFALYKTGSKSYNPIFKIATLLVLVFICCFFLLLAGY